MSHPLNVWLALMTASIAWAKAAPDVYFRQFGVMYDLIMRLKIISN